MNTNRYYENLIEEVIASSESKAWQQAVKEWEILSCEIDENQTESCICGKDRLKYLFTIKNSENGKELFPIGSSCIKRFGREDLQDEIVAYEEMCKLVLMVEKNEYIEFNADNFSRNLLHFLYNENVFEANKHNCYNAENDYLFMVSMFNKRNKEEIELSKKKKINAIIRYSIRPFLEKRIKVRKAVPKCPLCGVEMKKREAKKGITKGKLFWGCTNFPKCKHTENII